MAGFNDLVRDLVAVADTLTGSLQTNVTHYAWSEASVDASGKVAWGSGTSRAALVENVNTLVRNQQGELVTASTKVTFLRPVTIDVRDKIVLPDGKTGPIARISGMINPSTNAPYMVDVYLSSSGGSGW